MKINQILFPTDFSSPSDKALDHALVMAHRYHAHLTMLHVEVPYGADPNNPKFEFPRLDHLFDFIREQVSQRLEAEDLPVFSGDITISHEVLRGVSAPREILAYCDEHPVDLIIMGTHGRSGLGRFVLGSTAEKVMRGSAVPVLTIHHGEDLFVANGGRYRRILVPIDYSEMSQAALRRGVDLARTFEAELYFCHAIEQNFSPLTLFVGDPSPMKIDKELEKRSRNAFLEFAGNDLPENYAFHLSAGRPHTEIIHFIKEINADLVVLGNHGWNPVERWLLGGTTEKIIRKAPVPVFIVKQ